MGFWFMAGSGHVPWRYTASTSPAGLAAEVTGTDRKNMLGGKKKKNPPRHREQNTALAYFSPFSLF